MNQQSKIMKFLFEDSQVEESLQGDLEELFEDLAREEVFNVKKKPLIAALKELGVDTEGLDTDDCCLHYTTNDQSQYDKCRKALLSVDAINKLAELGWVTAFGGGESEHNAADYSKYKIDFINVLTAGEDDEKYLNYDPDKERDADEILKKANEVEQEVETELQGDPKGLKEAYDGTKLVKWYFSINYQLETMIKSDLAENRKRSSERLENFRDIWKKNKITGSTNIETVMILANAAELFANEEWDHQNYFQRVHEGLETIIAETEKLPAIGGGGGGGADTPGGIGAAGMEGAPETEFGPETDSGDIEMDAGDDLDLDGDDDDDGLDLDDDEEL